MTTATTAATATPARQSGNCTPALRPFQIKARTSTLCITYSALAESSIAAWMTAAELFDDAPCRITVTPGRPQ